MRRFIWIIPIVLVIIPLLRLQYFPMHDAQHIARLFVFDQAVREGAFYPRWVEGLGFGFGYPLFNFYPPLIYYIAEVFHLVGFGLIWSIKMMLIVGFILSFWGVYVLIYKKTKDTYSSMLGGLMYLMAPYHAVLVYIRGAFAEFFAYAIIPWVFVGFEVIQKTGSVSLFSLAFALLIISHPLIAFPFVLLFTGYFIGVFLISSQKRILVKWVAIGSAMGLGLSAFFWIPSMFERRFTLVDKILTHGLADYKMHFVYIRQLLYSPWGYGGSIYGLEDGMSFRIGEVQIVLAFIATITLPFLFFRKSALRLHILKISIFLGMGLLSAYLTIFKSQFIWDSISFLWYLQFPWRLLTFVAFFTSVGIALWVNMLQKKSRIVIVIIATIFICVLYTPLYKPAYYITGRDSHYITSNQLHWEVSKTSYEFMYKDIKTKQTGPFFSFPLEKKQLPSTLVNIHRNTRIEILTNKVAIKEISVSTQNKTSLTLNRSYFPGWNAYVDGRSTTIAHNDIVQRMTVTIPKGTHTVLFKFETTTIRVVSWIITFMSLLFWLYFVQIETMWAKRFWVFLHKSNWPMFRK
ncbi:hypothetical protein COU88_04245 [Candidatus Roizmanbacteria bacterium CG10_big_fil_rev_8_21_14_0_10_39_6]|uniref:Membrane protein 6-pyruvoyl-tetrahydropterin synthase-related domain-containing protein n=1 Tax=Candidatus Roizmanbacteria bacterium CG10_big_fil_rev_8_21_14_0_10_39_6 TaxID=1974853 RepID=A0A2M8KRM4_9BACT|nr:MAG: hypothetical protein COU88_04245 [Candidatus Roizmanbacteria bacterium CG10_big_fil_rev_8_21_14_0_10_39_6]